MDSPPKRMTRARAAAKATEPSVKTTKIVTAAAKAKTAAASSATAGTKSTAAKRKTRADENDDEDDEEYEELVVRKTRGRPKKVVETQEDSSAPAPVKATRGRPSKKAATEAATEEPAAPAKTRGRPRKIATTEADEPVKKTTRSRAGTLTKSSTAGAKPAVKKTVKFEEPDKENIEPTKDKEPPTASIRGRPSRRGGAAAGGRGGRAAAKSSEAGEKKPLSPKKVTQMPVSRDSSEDELAGGDTQPYRQMMKSPVKPPSNTMAGVKKSESKTSDKEASESGDAANNDNATELGPASMGSPPRRPPVSPLRDSMKSPAKRIGAVPLPGSTMKPSTNFSGDSEHTSTFKPTLLQSAAKRPLSPIKGLNFPSASKSQNPSSAMKTSMFQSPAKRALPGLKPLAEHLQRDGPMVGESPAMKPLVMSTPTPAYASRSSQKLMMEEQMQGGLGRLETDPFDDSVDSPQFSGRMSAVLPRFADPALDEEDEDVEEDAEEVQLVEEIQEYVESAEAAPEAQEEPVARDEEAISPALEEDDPMGMDEVVAEMQESTELPVREAVESPQAREPEDPMFQLRQKDIDICEDFDSGSESDDELEPSADAPGTPTPVNQRMSKGWKSGLSGLDGSRRSTIGITSLAEQFGSWSAASPIEPAATSTSEQSTESVDAPEQENKAPTPAAVEESPIKNSFFEDEMVVHSDVEPKEATVDHLATEDDDVDIDDLMVTEEDVALAHEANEMSLMESEHGEENVHPQSFDDNLSEASQEYGDENHVPVDPAMLESQPQEPATPLRPLQRSFNTTTKVPLKPADNSTPSPMKKRSFSASRVAPRRPGGITRSASVISYSPMKEKRRSSSTSRRQRRKSTSPPTPGPVTPTKSDMWSNMGTPARTPRKDINPSLLRGAVVFVDVHTSEGADASGIFVELLGQMGARCVKSWTWNPSSPSGRESSSKIGITHVVYKDGGKRTMEKVRETNGVVQCVGVSWVLDCERENEWLDEGPYYIDTALVPRGGARRRKSMEPLALANMNGTLVQTPNKGGPNTPLGRRQSTVWMHTPSDQGDQEEEDDVEWSKFILTPVPKTPAPEAIAKFAADMPETPSDADIDSSPTKQALLMQTCPPKSHTYQDMGEGILRQEKDEQVLMRLMAARRKSLQFAPKIGSPLARAWQS